MKILIDVTGCDTTDPSCAPHFVVDSV